VLTISRFNPGSSRQRGFTLIELMVGIVVGLIVLSSALAIYLMGVRGSTHVVRAAKLNQDMRTGMTLMVDDIRRADFWGKFVQGNANPFTARSGSPITDIHILNFNGVNNACILYSYDAIYQAGNTAGIPDQTSHPVSDFFGFRLGTNGALQMRQDGTTTNNCTDGNWETITNPNITEIQTLIFDTVGSQCLNVTVPAMPDWDVVADNTAVPACADTTNGDYIPPSPGDRLIELRQIRIRMTARHRNDPAMRASLEQSVKVRNDRIITF
jgi:prepilin peptidase dependent protein B